MVIAALRPHNELLAADLLPSHITLSNFTTIWQTGFGGNLVNFGQGAGTGSTQELSQTGSTLAALTGQTGNNNDINSVQTGSGNNFAQTQNGNQNKVLNIQGGSSNSFQVETVGRQRGGL